jgi:hypothetical protein
MSGIIPGEHHLGDMDVVCAFCGARTWESERMNCCSAGLLMLPPFPAVPAPLSDAILAPHVRQHIREYNMAMAMASVGHTNRSFPDGTFCLGGKTFHRIGSLRPAAGQHPAFAQIYVLDVEQAAERRMEVMGGREASVRSHHLTLLHSLLLLHNPRVQQFVQAAHSDVPHLVWRCSDDISAMQIGTMIAEPGEKRDIVVRRHSDGQLQFLHDGHPLYHPLAYPLLFPLGTSGWHENLEVTSADYSQCRKVSLTEWGRYYMMHRDQPTHWQKCERLAAEFYCDIWAQVESRNAQFHRSPKQQAKYRGCRVAAFEDQLSSGVPASDIGQPVIRLPSSFVGSARFYQQLYLDAMALPKKFGKPDLFITMTCNPHWPEIRNALPPNSHWKHHMDIVNRVFALKSRQFIKEIVKDDIFGPVLAYVCRIEWQARGMPHAHMLFILRDKVMSPRHIDAIISAELPDPEREPMLFSLVTTHMLHGRCDMDTSCGCRRNASDVLCDCVRGYPKDMSKETVVIPDGYPKYRRRGRFTADIRGRFLTDDWVVPHNKYLLLRWKCHINLEICSSFRCFKYVYKYTFKPPDSTAITVDEVEAHLAGRLLSASEAVYRLLALPLHKEWPNVFRLDIHMPQQHRMVFDPTADEEQLLEELATSTSTLLGWFQLNADDEFARSLLYHDIPGHYTWDKAMWRRRIYKVIAMTAVPQRVTSHVCQTQPVGRVYGVSHHNGELMALRMLLGIVKGATSFEDLATCDGVVHSSFRSACFARGMMSDDSDLQAALQEIIEVTVSVDQIRLQFARLLVHSSPQDPQALFNVFVDDLCGAPADQSEINVALLSIEEHMQRMGRSLAEADFGFVLPAPHVGQPLSRRRHRASCSQMSVAEAIRQRDELIATFSAEQSDALAEICSAVESDTAGGKVFALISSAGCGKTIFANGLAAYLNAQRRKVRCVAASALAAMLLPAGCTAHSAFHLPIPCNETTTCNLSHAERQELKHVDLIIYDECSMVHADVANTLDRTLRDIMNVQQPFGGKAILWMGDFKQLLPVVRFGKGHVHTLQSTQWWKLVRRIEFHTNFRAILNPVYTAFLEDVGHGRIDTVTVPSECQAVDFADLIDKVYGSDFPNGHQILALTLETCDVINKMCFEKIGGNVVESPAADVYVDCFDRDAYPTEYVASLSIKGVPPWMLHLKEGAKYMCIKNLDADRGIINGTMMRLMRIGRRFLQMKVLSGKSEGSVEVLLKCCFTASPEASGLPFALKRTQFPIIPAYCLSVHKAQGQSLLQLGIVFETDPFTHGQLYVALSRVGGWQHVIAFHQGDNIKNVVHKHLL